MLNEKTEGGSAPCGILFFSIFATSIHLFFHMRELIKCLFLAVVVAMAVGCESDDDPFAPDKNEVYGYEFDCGLAQHVDNQEQTVVVNESTVEGVPEEDSEWNMVRISAYVGPNGSKKYVSYDYNESTETYHYDWCSFSVERIDRKHRRLKVHVAENHTGDSRAIIVEFRKNSNSSAKKYKGEFSIIQGNSDAAE